MKKVIFLIFSAIIIISGCTKISTTTLGNGLIPPIDGVNTFDTIIDVTAETFVDPTDTTRVFFGDLHTFGQINNDPIFGSTNARILFEPKPPYFKYYFPPVDSTAVDSAVLVLSYASFYGDSSQSFTVNVREIDPTTPLKPRRPYPVQYPNVNATDFINTIPIPGFVPKTTSLLRITNDSVVNRYEKSVRQIRLPLPIAFANRFVKIYDSTAGNAYASDADFRKKFAGFEISATSGNSLITINLADTNTKLCFYFNYQRNGKRDTTFARFNLYQFSDTTDNVLSRQANFITRNRPGNITTNGRPGGDSLVYVQTSPGTFVRVRIPGLKGLSNRIIHRAELIAEQVPDIATDLKFLPPRYMLLCAYDSVNKGKRNIPNDFIVGSQGPDIAYFGGDVRRRVDPVWGSIAYYNFNLTRYVQGHVTRGDSLYDFRLYAPANDRLFYKPPYPNNTYPLYSTSIDSLKKPDNINSIVFTPSTANFTGYGRVRLAGGAGAVGGTSPNRSSIRMRLRIIYSRL